MAKKKTKGDSLEVFLKATNLFCDVTQTAGLVRLCRQFVHYIPSVTAKLYIASDLGSEVAENCAILVYYAASNGNLLQTFRDNLSVPSAGGKKPKENCRVCYRSSYSQQASLSSLYSEHLVD